jgi:hypothetical protein
MSNDPIVEEIRKARAELIAPFGEDMHAFFEYIRQRERESGDNPVTLERIASDPETQSISSR